MTGNDSPTPVLTAKQEKAVVALLTENSIASAAQKAGVSEKTLFRWLKDDPFKASYRDARREVVTQAVSQISQTTGKAVATLRAVCDDGDAPAGARVSAAKTLLDMAFRGVEIDDLAARVETLESELSLLMSSQNGDDPGEDEADDDE